MQEMMNTNYPGASAKQPNSPPVLGGQLPGLTSELPAPRGLTPYFNPMAQELQSYGRNGDSMLVHMHPDEVKGLQQLAMAHGGSLTINPHTGLPEAGWLKKLLPTLIGAILTPLTGGLINPLTAGLIVGGVETVRTGSLAKGLMAGLGAYGGAGLSTAFLPNLAGNVGKAALSNVGRKGVEELVKAGAEKAASLGMPTAGFTGPVGSAGVNELMQAAGEKAASLGMPQEAFKVGARDLLKADVAGLKQLGQTAMKNPISAVKEVGQRFVGATRDGLTPGSFMYKYAPQAAGFGAFTNIADAMQPPPPKFDTTTSGSKWVDEGPYVMPPREVTYEDDESSNFEGGGERLFFNPSNPVPGYVPLKSLSPEERTRYGYAEGGLAALPASKEFKDLVEFYNTGRPGAITASLTYPKKAAPTTTTDTGTTTTGTTSPGTTTTGTTNPGTTTTGGGGGGGGGGPGDVYVNPNVFVTTDWDTSATTNTGTGATQTTDTGRYGDYDNTSLPRVVTEDSVNYRDATGPHTTEVQSIGSPGAAVLTGPTSNYGVQDNSSLNDIIASQLNDYFNSLGVTQGMQNQAANNMFGTTGVNYYAQTGNQGANTQDGGQAVNTGQTMGGNALTLYDGSTFTLPDDFYVGTQVAARGGRITMGDGSFVVDARTVSELGNGSSNAGIEYLKRLGGQPVRGPGDGVSDSVPASIGGRQAARVARDEVIFPPQAVQRLGGGSEKRGTQKLYAMMEKAHAARKRAGRGTDTKLRRGLA